MSDYARQKLFEAVEALIGPAPIQDRLRHAKNPISVLAAHPEASKVPMVAKIAEGFRNEPIEKMTERQMEVFADQILAAYEAASRL